jgi:ATP phosphoribosyltransferase regulatory subunit HisZ
MRLSHNELTQYVEAARRALYAALMPLADPAWDRTRRVTRFIDEKRMVKVSHFVTKGKAHGLDRRARSVSVVVTIGAPSHAGRLFVSRRKKAGTSLDGAVHLQALPKKVKKAKKSKARRR